MFFSKKDDVVKAKEIDDLDRELETLHSMLEQEREEFDKWRKDMNHMISFASLEKDYLGTVLYSKLGEGTPYAEKYETRLLSRKAQIAEYNQHLEERTMVFERFEKRVSSKLAHVGRHRDRIFHRLFKKRQ